MHSLPPLAPVRQSSRSGFREASGYNDPRRLDVPRSAAGSRANTPPGLTRASSAPRLGLGRSSSLPPIDGADTKLSRQQRKFSFPSGDSREDAGRLAPRGRSASRNSSPQPNQSSRPSSVGVSVYEEECKRRLILPKFLRNAQSALHGEELDLADLSLGDAQFEALLCDTVLVPREKITCWKVCGDRLTNVGANALNSALHKKVRVLNLARNDFGNKGVEAMRGLSASYRLIGLRSLNLSSNGLRSDALTELCDALLICQLLLRLDLNCNEIREGSALGGLLAEHVNLTRLAIHGNYLLAAGGVALFQGVHENFVNGGRLADVDVAWNGLGEGNSMEFAKVLAQVLSLPSLLFHLDLSYNGLDSNCCAVVADAMRDNQQLYGLHMVGNSVVVDSNGFLTPLALGANEKPSCADPVRGLMFGDPRSGPRQCVGCNKRSAVDRQCAKQWSDDEILRDRDPLEQQTTCWACEGWERAQLCWAIHPSEEMPCAVWAFTNLDNFRVPLRLRLDSSERRFVGARMVPPDHRLLAIFQVDTSLQLQPNAEVEDLESPVSISICFCKELPKTEPSTVQVSQVCAPSIERTTLPMAGGGFAGKRVVLIDGPDGPVEMPRITESELKSKTIQLRQRAILTTFRRDNDKILRRCFELDWSMVKKVRLVPAIEEGDVAKLVEASYGHIVAIYKHLSAIGVGGDSGFGVTSLEAGNFATEVGLVDGQVTSISDIDRLVIAANVMATEVKSALVVRSGKALMRFQFLEFLLRVADQRFRQSGEVSSMAAAVGRVLECLQPLAELRLKAITDFFAAFHTDDVEDVYKEHLPILEAAYRRFGGRAGPTGHSSFMSHRQFQELLERAGAYDSEFQQRQSGVAFRMGMMTQADECQDTRFQEMTFLEFLHALGAVVFLRSGCTADRMVELVSTFFLERIVGRGLVPDALDRAENA